MKRLNSSPTGAVVVDGSVAIAISAKETNREQKANAELLRFSTAGYLFYAPGAIIAETLYVLCGKAQNGILSASEHAQAMLDFKTFMENVLPPPGGEASIIERAEAIRAGYGCSRSADGIYIALAEELAASVTFCSVDGSPNVPLPYLHCSLGGGRVSFVGRVGKRCLDLPSYTSHRMPLALWFVRP